MIRKTTFLAALAGFAASASAQMPGDILFTTNDRGNGSDTIQLLDYSSLTASLLVSFPAAPDTDHRINGGIAQGPSGEFYLSNSPYPVQNPSTASIYRVDNMFNAGTRTVSTFASSDPIQSVEGMAYDPLTNNLLFANNPGSDLTLPLREEGVIGIDINNAANVSVVVPEPNFGDPLPNPVAFNVLEADRTRASNYYVGAVNGGVGTNPSIPFSTSSIINRLVMNNPADPTDVSFDMVIDLADANTGLGESLTFIRGIASLDDGNLIVAEEDTRSLYSVELDGNGDFVSIAKIFDLDAAFDSDNTGVYFVPFNVTYNEYTNKINYVERNATAGDGTSRIVEINLDGTGHNVLLDNVKAGALFIVPAPSALALLGLGGLAATRRRR